MDILKYKGYEGTSEIDMERCVCRGKVLFINDLVTYETDSPKKLRQEFEAAVDDYLETCEFLERDPKKPLKGKFNVRISPSLHKEAVTRALRDSTSLNDIVAKSIDTYIHGVQDVNHNITIEVKGTSDGVETLMAMASSETQWLAPEQRYEQ